MAMREESIPEFKWHHAEPGQHQTIVLPKILHLLPDPKTHPRLLDLGSGNGWLSEQYRRRGFAVTAADASSDGIRIGRQAFPEVAFHQISVYDDLLQSGDGQPFDVVVSSEVIEHLTTPKRMLDNIYRSLRPDGMLILTTPYHGYLKNLALSVADKWDKHHSVTHDGGHIKFFSRRSLTAMMREAGFSELRFAGAGRAPFLWMSMVVAGIRPL